MQYKVKFTLSKHEIISTRGYTSLEWIDENGRCPEYCMSAEILVIGSLNMDLVVSADRRPKVGETILGNSFSTYPGGKGANQAVAAARLGAQVRLSAVSVRMILATH